MKRFKNLKNKYKKLENFIPLVLFVFTFCLLMMYKNNTDFIDEANVMLGAKILSKGKFIYLDFASQHLPFTYFIFAPFALMGVNSVVGFRLCMYLLLSLIWAFFFWRYSKYFGWTMLILYPICYILFMSVPNFQGTTLISEQIQSQCLALLYLELLLFYQKKHVDKLGKILIPIAIVISIGTAFVSILPCFFAIITFFYIDIKNLEQPFSLKKYGTHFLKEYKRILIIGFGMVLLFLLYLFLTGSLKECYLQAFALNFDVYSKYNQYSSNPLITIIKILPKFLVAVRSYLQSNFTKLLYLGLWISVVAAFTKLLKRDKIFAIFMLYYVLLCGNRTFIEFHALPFYAVSILCGLYFMKDLNIKYQKIIFLILLVAFLKQCGGYVPNIYKSKPIDQHYYEVVDKLSDSEELFHIDLNTQGFIYSDKFPASRFDGWVPWFSDVYENEMLNTIKQKKPNVIFYQPYGQVWGYLYKDFASNINQYILEQYCYINKYNLWIRKDKIKWAEQTLKEDLPEFDNTYNQNTLLALNNNFVEQKITATEDILKLGLRFTTHNRMNYSVLHMEIWEGETLYLNKILSTNELSDNGYLYWRLEKNLKSDHEYVLKITPEFTHASDYVSIYKVSNEFGVDQNKLYINGIEYKENLLMEMYYEKEN